MGAQLDTIWLGVNAGGKATRMGPWAPRLKPFLPVAAMQRDSDGNEFVHGPCPVERILINYAAYMPCERRHQLVPVVSLGAGNAAVLEYAEVVAGTPWADGVLLAMDAPGVRGPMALAHRVPKGVGMVLHNGDDLISYEALSGFLDAVLDNPAVTRLMVSEVEQQGKFGRVVVTPTGFRVMERPTLDKSLVGCGVLYVSPHDLLYAQRLSNANSSTVLNAIELAYSKAKGGMTPPALFKIDERQWATMGTPAEYMDVCANEFWTEKEPCVAAWRAATGGAA